MRFLHVGDLGKAARDGEQKGVPVLSAQMAAETLRQLHPEEAQENIPRSEEVDIHLAVSAQDVSRAIRKRMSRGACPGIDGWTRELLMPILEHEDLVEDLAALTQDIANCRVSASFSARVRASAVIPLQKDTLGNVRPITPESVWLKLPSIVAFGKLDFSARRKFRAYQHGVWGGAAVAVKRIREARTSDPRNVVVALNGRNAYNAKSRRAILEATFGDPALRHIWGIACLALGTPGTPQLFDGEKAALTLESKSGVRQGMVLGPLLFAAGLHEALQPVMSRHPKVRFIAYLDDIALVGNEADIQDALGDLHPALQRFGYHVNASKCAAIQGPAGRQLAVGGGPSP
eukprot:gene3800-biopygen2658